MLAAGATPAAAEICLHNDSQSELLLVVDVADKATSRTGGFGTVICLPGDAGTVRVFTDFDAIEGCSRLSQSGQVERLVDFTEFDNCTWAKTPRP